MNITSQGHNMNFTGQPMITPKVVLPQLQKYLAERGITADDDLQITAITGELFKELGLSFPRWVEDKPGMILDVWRPSRCGQLD